MPENYKWKFKANPDSVALARSAVAEFAISCGFYREVAEDIKLAVGEACNNAVEHAGCEKDFNVSCGYDEDALVVSIEDHGQGFEFKPPDPNRELLQSRGLGIFLMRKLMDSVSYRRKPGDGTQVILEKHKIPARGMAAAAAAAK
ncbi:MAG: ATP-binding protein [Candidatus Eremiobacteraeota bacterium]|nr:ATP-binding protein [Candidatus Eremiobacteraeota bacterium]